MRDLDFTGERLIPGIKGKIEIEHLHRYFFAMDLVNDKSVLDIACGEGYGSNLLSKKAHNVLGVDISNEIISHANKTYSSNKLKFLQGSVTNIPVDDRFFDVIVSFETIEHLSEHELMMNEFKRVLKEDGLLIISSPEKEKYSDSVNGRNSKFHVKELYLNEFEDLLNSSFQFTNVCYQNFVTGSMIKYSNDLVSNINFINGDFNDFYKFKIFKPEFVIILASDVELDNSQLGLPSLFNRDDLINIELQNIIDSKLNKVKNSLRYRLADIVFYPFDKLKSFFK